MKYEAGTHQYSKQFNCFECALRYYENQIKNKKYLAELDLRNKPKKILLNTYGWENN